MLRINKMRLPTCEEYDLLATTTKEDNDTMHWSHMYSWCQDEYPGSMSTRAVRGWVSARCWGSNGATNRNVDVGFRPTFEVLHPDPLTPDGTIITVGTLYMDGKPVRVPQNPTRDGDIPNYIPGASLEMREALDDPDYQVQAIKAGDVLIVDRILLKNISWEDLAAQGIAKKNFTTTKEDENMSIIAFTDTEFGSFAIACSPENREKVRGFIEKRYPEWAARSKGKTGLTPWNDVLDAIEDMRELLGDEKLEFIDRCSVGALPE